MPAVSLTLADLTPFDPDLTAAKATILIQDALALGELVAPCIGEADLTPKKAAAAKAILRGAILRWNDSGSGGRTQVSDTVGAFAHSESFDTTQPRRSRLWPSEITDLQKICQSEGSGSGRTAWGYDTAGGTGPQHAATCAVNLGATFCDCGAVLTGSEPLWGNDDD